MDNRQNYKRKNYYHKPGRGGGGSNNWNKKFKNQLQIGMKGFMCTCNSKFREKECVKEALNILNEYADKIHGADDVSIQNAPSNTDQAESTNVDASGEDIEDDLKKEISNLRASQWTSGRFTAIDTGMPAIIFIRTTLEDPVQLAHTVLSEAAATKTQKARSLLRLLPVEIVCRAKLEDIKSTADSLFDKHFRCEPTTFSIVLNKRYNDSILRDEVIHALALLVTDKNKEHKANLSEPIYTVLVEIFKGFCLMSVVKEYKTLRHYNIAELTKPEQSEEENGDPKGKSEESEVTEENQDDGKTGEGNEEFKKPEEEDGEGSQMKVEPVDESGDKKEVD